MGAQPRSPIQDQRHRFPGQFASQCNECVYLDEGFIFAVVSIKPKKEIARSPRQHREPYSLGNTIHDTMYAIRPILGGSSSSATQIRRMRVTSMPKYSA